MGPQAKPPNNKTGKKTQIKGGGPGEKAPWLRARAARAEVGFFEPTWQLEAHSHQELQLQGTQGWLLASVSIHTFDMHTNEKRRIL